MSLIASPFHARAVEANRLNAWENRNGYTLAAHYGSPAEEAVAAHFGAVLCDLSWQWRVEITGAAAAAFVSRLFTRDASALGTGAAMDILWLNDAGAVRGVGTVVRLAADRFALVSAQADAAWVTSAAQLYGVTVEDRSASTGALALIGPAAAKILSAAGLDPQLPPRSCRQTGWRGVDVSLSRHGLGYEIVCDADQALIVWDRLARAGRNFALLPAGLAAYDILALENGIVRPGSDFVAAREGFTAAPAPQSLGLIGFVDCAHLFNGRAGVLAAGPATVLAGVLADGEALIAHLPLTADGQPVGRTLGACVSPALQRAIALAVLPDGVFGSATNLLAGSVPCRIVPVPLLALPLPATETGKSSV